DHFAGHLTRPDNTGRHTHNERRDKQLVAFISGNRRNASTRQMTPGKSPPQARDFTKKEQACLTLKFLPFMPWPICLISSLWGVPWRTRLLGKLANAPGGGWSSRRRRLSVG